MRFENPNCPECGESLKGTGELVPGTALMSQDDDGEWEYDGSTEMCWDGQTTETDKDGRVELWCRNGHCWHSAIVEATEAQKA